MKKTFTKLFTLLLAVVLGLSTLVMTACGDDGIDESKTQVYVYTVSDGYGYQYMEKLVNDWNAAHADSEYQFIWAYGTEGYLHIHTQLDSNTCADKNIWVGSNTYIVDYVKKGYVIDISDVYEMEVDGKKIKDKVIGYEQLKQGYSDYFGNGMYAMPHGFSISPSLVFDFEHFLRKGYLDYAKESELSAINAQEADAVEVKAGNTLDNSKYFRVSENVLVAKKAFGNYEVGDVVLTAGRDGKYGTYDDGQRQTVAEFYDLLKKITVQDNAFIYTTQYATANTHSYYMSMMYQNLGFENTKVLSSFNGTLKNADGSVAMENVTMDNADKMWDTDVMKNAITSAANFFDQTVLGRLEGSDVTKMLNVRTWNNGPTSSLSHVDAQRGFALDHHDRGTQGYKESAFLIEGTWWENESQTVLSQLGGYGADAVEHRFYLNPIADGQVGPKDQTVYAGSNGANCMMYLNNYPKNVTTDEQKAAYDKVCKEFIAYTCSDAALNWYTECHGIRAGFDYELTEQTLKKITPFQRNCFEMLADTEHIKIVDTTTSGGNKNIPRKVFEIYDFQAKKDNNSYHVYTAMYGLSPIIKTSEWYDCVKDYIQSDYAKKLANSKEYIASLNK